MRIFILAMLLAVVFAGNAMAMEYTYYSDGSSSVTMDTQAGTQDGSLGRSIFN